MAHIQWIFSGIGTEILILIIVLIGGFIGFRLHKRRIKFSQSQKAGDNSEQHQEGYSDFSVYKEGKGTKNSVKFNQSQKAGNKSTQVQIGGNRDA